MGMHPAGVAGLIGFCCCYGFIIILILAVAILSRLDPVTIFLVYLFESFFTGYLMISMVCRLLKNCIRVEGMRSELVKSLLNSQEHKDY